ncbi:MAG: hypothetical protein IKK34_12910 [Clostridia bacterium]|nr:hypothetical protein [Clostridia bacterium]MBR3796909.1 hypothetical protein [Clostridia bacterium]
MIKGGLKRNGKDYRPDSGRGRRKLSTMIARQLVNGMIKPFTQLGPGQGPSTPGVVQSHRAQGGGQHKQAGAGAGGLGFDEVNKSKSKRKKGDKTP